ncbi:hypothetical protein HY029_00820 [Candidatus Gottesmanbacteria bacterium]|nr:hypothetical protein [Candidatus Gottesmanbacteria bacterium]
MAPTVKELNVEVTSEQLIKAQGPIKLNIHDERPARQFTPGRGRSQFDITPPRPLGASDTRTIFEG